MSTAGGYGSADYVDPPRRYRSRRERDRGRDDGYAESVYIERDGPRSSRQMELIRRPREESDEYIEEVQRDFPPGEGYGRPRRNNRTGASRRTRSLERGYDGYGSYSDYNNGYGYGDDAAAAYYRSDPRRSVDDDYYDRRSRRDAPDDRGQRRRRRSLSRFQELAAAGGGAALAIGAKELYERRSGKSGSRTRNPLATAAVGVAGAVAGDLAAQQFVKTRDRVEDREDSRYRDSGAASYAQSDYEGARPRRKKSIGDRAMSALGLRDDDGSSDDERGGRGSGRRSDDHSRSRSRGKIEQAIKAAITAGAVEAFRVRKEPGGWGGEKGRRILTAAAGAGGLDALVDRDPNHHSKSHIIEAVIGGLAGNRAINGPRTELRDRSRSRSRSRSGRTRSRRSSGLGELAAAGVAAAVGKGVYDRTQRRRSPSSGSDSTSPAPRRRRSRSVSDYVNRGMNALGLKENDRDRDDRRADGVVARRDNGGRVAPYSQSRSMIPSEGAQRGRTARGPAEKKGGSSRSSSTSSISTSEEERRHRKMRTKELLTAGLATVATIHAAHSLYEGMEGAKERRKALAEGEITPEEAKRRKTKSRFQDLAAVGLAALGIKGAVSQWMEMRKKHQECIEFEKRAEERRRKRQERMKQQKGSSQRGQGPSGNGPYGGGYYGNAPMYQDANPYSARTLPPPPPMGLPASNARRY